MFNINLMSKAGKLVKLLVPALQRWLSIEENDLLAFETPADRAAINEAAAELANEVTGVKSPSFSTPPPAK